jgi:transcriptional regulator with XRE-family HTH domain
MTDKKQQLRLLGQAIRSVREEKTSTVGELATAVGVRSERLQALESGALDPDYELLLRIADCLNTSPSALVIRAEELAGSEDE